MLSKFFSENVKILPKYIDLINFPLFAFLFTTLVVSFKKKSQQDGGETRFILYSFGIFSICTIISILFSTSSILFPASILFYVGLIEGPVLYISLNKYVRKTEKMISNLNKYFIVLLIFNLAIVFLINLPEFAITGNPDKISGAYGNNQNQFSTLLLINGAYLLGYNFMKKSRTSVVIITQLVIFIVFYLSQFRAATPFFLVSYFIIIGILYGKRILYRLIPIATIGAILIASILYLTESDERVKGLRYEEWGDLISHPLDFLYLGKFQIYGSVIDMYKDYPETILTGAGPGNFLSRANFTFNYEINVKGKGVGEIIKDIFDIKYSYYSDLHYKYVKNRIAQEIIFGTYQLSNPATSYLSALSEIGIIGGMTIITLYIFLIIKSIKFFRIIREKNPQYIPLAIALVGITTYVFQLAFLEYYWEMARVTLPVWLLFWAVKTIAYSKSEEEQEDANNVSQNNNLLNQ